MVIPSQRKLGRKVPPQLFVQRLSCLLSEVNPKRKRLSEDGENDGADSEQYGVCIPRMVRRGLGWGGEGGSWSGGALRQAVAKVTKSAELPMVPVNAIVTVEPAVAAVGEMAEK